MKGRIRWIFAVLLFAYFIGCSPTIQVKSMDPVKLKHTYAVEIVPSYPADETTKKVIEEMGWILTWERQVFTVLPASKEYINEKEVESFQSTADAIILLKKVSYSPETAELNVDFLFYEFATHLKASRSIEVLYHGKDKSKKDVLKILARKLTRDMLDQLDISDEVFLSTGLGGMGDGGAEAEAK